MRRVLVVVGLAVVLGGGSAVAASRWVITSTHQIKPSVLRQLRGERGPRGWTGATGPQGVQGQTGPAGSFSPANVQIVQAQPVYLCPAGQAQQCNIGGGYAACPPGKVAIGGGWQGPLVDTTISDNYPGANDTAWYVTAASSASIYQSFTPYAVCAG